MGIRLSLVILLALAGAADARRRPPPPPPTQVIQFVRTAGGVLERGDRASIVRFLTASTWDGPGGRLRFVDSRFSHPPGRERALVIRDVQPMRGGIRIVTDGVTFTLTSCRIGRVMSSCLDRTVGGFGGDGYGGF